MGKLIFCAVPVGDIVLRVSDKDIIFICFLILPSNKFRVVLLTLSLFLYQSFAVNKRPELNLY